MKDVFVEIFGFFIYPFVTIYELWVTWLVLLKPDGLFPSVIFMIITMAIIMSWLYAGCICASLAETKMRNPVKHFFLGLLLPYIHVGTLKLLPAIADSFAEIEDIKAQKAENLKAELTGKFDGGTEYMSKSNNDTEEEVEEEVIFNYDRDFFESLVYSEAGYTAILSNGRVIEMENISEIGDDYIMVDVFNMQGEMQRLRLVYRMIDTFAIREILEEDDDQLQDI